MLWRLLPILRLMRRHGGTLTMVALQIATVMAVSMNTVGLVAYIWRTAPFFFSAEQRGDAQRRVLLTSVPRRFPTDGLPQKICPEDLEALRALPGVHAAAHAEFLIFKSRADLLAYHPPASRSLIGGRALGDEHLLEATGARLLWGRNFTSAEVDTEAPVVLLTLEMAQGLFRTPERAVQATVVDHQGTKHTVIGVIDSLVLGRLRGIIQQSVVHPQRPRCGTVRRTLVAFDPKALQLGIEVAEGAAIQTLLDLDPDRAVQSLRLSDWIAFQRSGSIGSVGLVVIFSLFYICVPVLGVVGLTVFTVQRRRRSIGIRRALGATREAILGELMVEVGLTVAVGIVLGIGLGYGLNAAIRSVVIGLEVDGWMTVMCATVYFILLVTSALIPVWEATRIPPHVATQTLGA
ncbi:MAG: FtsX-like permease family protein [Myxococcota bacterium]